MEFEPMVVAIILLWIILLLLGLFLAKARLQGEGLVHALGRTLKTLLSRGEKASLDEFQVGIVLNFIGGGLAFLDSITLLTYRSHASIALAVALLILAGCVIAYMGFGPLGTSITFFSSIYAVLLTQIHTKLLISSYSLLNLIGSVLMLFALGKTRKGGEKGK